MNTISASPTQTPCLVGFWGHLFGPGKRETMCRLRFDLNANRLTHLEIQEGAKFYPATEAQRADVEDSLLTANPEVLEEPGDFGLIRVLCNGPEDWPDQQPD